MDAIDDGYGSTQSFQGRGVERDRDERRAQGVEEVVRGYVTCVTATFEDDRPVRRTESLRDDSGAIETR